MRLTIDTDDDYFGVCPECSKSDGYANIGRDYWFICHEHNMRWVAGSNLFSSWRDETEDEQRKAWAQIAAYRIVGPMAERLTAIEASERPAPRFVTDPVTFRKALHSAVADVAYQSIGGSPWANKAGNRRRYRRRHRPDRDIRSPRAEVSQHHLLGLRC